MHRFLLPSPFILLLSFLFLYSFHGYLVSSQGFTGLNSLTSVQHGSVDASGILTLDAATTGTAQAFHSQPISLFDSSDVTLASFTSFFTFVSDATTGNGSIVFAFVPDEPKGTVSLADARKTLTIEFNTSCATGVFDASGGYYGTRGEQDGYWGEWGGGMGGFFGGLGGFQVAEYAGSSSISIAALGGYGPSWENQTVAGPYFCSQEPPLDLPNPTFQYVVAVEYNASTDTVWVGSPSCGEAIARTTQFDAKSLSNILPKSVYVGFLVSGGGVFNISQWNFTTDVNTSSITNLLGLSTSTVPSSTTPSTVTNPSINNGGSHVGSHGGMKKGYVIAFSVLGTAIGVAAVALVCCLYARRKRATSAKFVGKSVHQGAIPESAVIFDARKPTAPPAPNTVPAEGDTTPLNSRPNSVFHGSTGAASWLQPVAPR